MERLRVAALVDLPRDRTAGGHVKYWERLAEACAKENAPVDLTVYFSGAGADENLSPHVKFRYLPPVFSTARLKFLPYVPAHTDLAPFHPGLARELPSYDVLHATDGYFAFARTAERVSRKSGIPLVSSFHTDTPAYAELFTKQMLHSLLGNKFGAWADSFFSISGRQRKSKITRLKTHIRACSALLALRPEDKDLAQKILSPDRIKNMRLGVDKNLFSPNSEARTEVERDYRIPSGKFLALFVGRIDAGKNMPLLLQACTQALEKGANLHLMVVGIGPMLDEVRGALGPHVTLTGLLPVEKLAKLYMAADTLCMVSDIEIGGLIGVEALACGCPVLASRSSSVTSPYSDTAAVEGIDSDATSWAVALVSLEQDKVRQKEMRAAAQAFRRDRLAGWGEVLKEDFLPVWQNVMRRKKR